MSPNCPSRSALDCTESFWRNASHGSEQPESVAVERLVSPVKSAAAQSVVSSSRIILTTLPFIFPDNYVIPTSLLFSKPRRRPLPRRQEDRRGLLWCHLRRSAILSPLSPVLSSNLNPFLATGTNLLNSQTVAIKFVSPCLPWCPLVLLFAILTQPPAQEPRKAEAPQLRDECRSYRILTGCSQYNVPFRWKPYPVGFDPPSLTPLNSRHPSNLPLWSRGVAQHPRHRPVGAQSRRSVRYVRSKIRSQDRLHGCQANGMRPLRLQHFYFPSLLDLVDLRGLSKFVIPAHPVFRSRGCKSFTKRT